MDWAGAGNKEAEGGSIGHAQCRGGGYHFGRKRGAAPGSFLGWLPWPLRDGVPSLRILHGVEGPKVVAVCSLVVSGAGHTILDRPGGRSSHLGRFWPKRGSLGARIVWPAPETTSLREAPVATRGRRPFGPYKRGAAPGSFLGFTTT